MNLKSHFLFALSLVIIGSNSFAAESLSLEDCISLAKKNNLELAQAKIAVEQARAGVMDAYSSYYPSIDLSSGYKYGEGYLEEGSYSTNIDVQCPIFTGGYVRAGTKSANARVKMEKENYRLTENEIILTVKEAFFKILQKQDQATLIDDILKRRKEDLAIIKLKYDAGRESSPAVKEAEANLLQAEYDKMEAQEELSLAKVALNLLLGRPRREELSVKYEDEDIEFPPLEEIVKEAKTERPEIRAEISNKEVLKAQVTQAKSEYFPTISLSSSYGLQGNKFLEQETDWSVGISLSLSIFNGFSTKAKVREATLSLKEEESKIQDLEQQIEEEIEQTWVNLELAEKNREVSDKTLEAAHEMYELTKLQYEQARTSYLFLQQKESALTQAEYNYVNALYNLRIARASLQKAWGRRDQ
jgi:outer membrane protein